MLFYWYFLLHLNYDIKQKETSSDSTKSRDQQIDQQMLPESPAPTPEITQAIRAQIHFIRNSHIDEIQNILTFTGNTTYISQNITNLPVYANIPHIYDPPKVQHDKQLEEFLRGEIHCQNYINQDLTFLQPLVIHASQQKEDNMVQEKNTIAVSLIKPQENNLPQEQDANSLHVLPAEGIYDRNRVNNTAAPIQQVEPVVGLTPEGQHKN